MTGAYPNPQIAANSILSADIAAGAVDASAIAEGAITSAAIRDDTINSVDIANEGLSLFDLAPGSVGASELVETIVVSSFPNPVNPGGTGGNAATCPVGTQLIGGGINWDGGGGRNLFAILSGPERRDPATAPPHTWEVAGQNNSGATRSVFAEAICLKSE